MKAFLLVIFILLSSVYTYSQLLDKKWIDNRIKQLYPSEEMSDLRLYAINGKQYFEKDSIKIDSVLRLNNLNLLDPLFFLSYRKTYFHCNCDLVVVSFAYNQKYKTKRHLLKKARHSFLNGKNPTLFINNEAIKEIDASKRFKSLQLKTINYIEFIGKPNTQNVQINVWSALK